MLQGHGKDPHRDHTLGEVFTWHQQFKRQPAADFISSSSKPSPFHFVRQSALAVHRTSIDCTIRRCVESLEKSATCTDNGTGLIRKVTPLQYSLHEASTQTKHRRPFFVTFLAPECCTGVSQDVLKLAKVKTGEMAVVKLLLVN